MEIQGHEIEDCIDKAVKQSGMSREEALKAIDGFYRGVSHIIQIQKPQCIKVEFFGKFLWSDMWKQKKWEMILAKKELNEENTNGSTSH